MWDSMPGVVSLALSTLLEAGGPWAAWAVVTSFVMGSAAKAAALCWGGWKALRWGWRGAGAVWSWLTYTHPAVRLALAACSPAGKATRGEGEWKGFSLDGVEVSVNTAVPDAVAARTAQVDVGGAEMTCLLTDAEVRRVGAACLAEIARRRAAVEAEEREGRARSRASLAARLEGRAAPAKAAAVWAHSGECDPGCDCVASAKARGA